MDKKNKKKKFAEGFCFYKYFWIFIIGSIIGFLYEVMLEYVHTGSVFSKQELIFGPFTIVYGMGAVAYYLLISKVKDPKEAFFSGAIMGGIL